MLRFAVAQIQPNARLFVPVDSNANPPFHAVPSTAGPVLRYEAGSTVKLEQVLGEEDKQLH